MKNVKRILYELMWIAIVLIVFPFEILLASIIAVFKKGRKWLTKRAKECEIYIDIFTSQYVSDKLMKTYFSIARLIIKIDMWFVEINQALDEDVY